MIKYTHTKNKIGSQNWRTELEKGILISIYKWGESQKFDWHVVLLPEAYPHKTGSELDVASGTTDTLKKAKSAAEKAAKSVK